MGKRVSADDYFDLSKNPLHSAVGEAIEAYTQVEAALARLLQSILKIDVVKAHAIFFAVLSTRARNELIEVLLQAQFNGGLTKYWGSCSTYLQKLSKFRNALAHWHPFVNVYLPSDLQLPARKVTHALGHPAYGSGYEFLEVEDIPPFLRDCAYIRGELSSLIEVVQAAPDRLPQKFLQPIRHPNQAHLPRRQKSKGSPRQQLSSQAADERKKLKKKPKLSSKQRRLRAMGISKRARPD